MVIYNPKADNWNNTRHLVILFTFSYGCIRPRTEDPDMGDRERRCNFAGRLAFHTSHIHLMRAV